jgi:hypothetical protein
MENPPKKKRRVIEDSDINEDVLESSLNLDSLVAASYEDNCSYVQDLLNSTKSVINLLKETKGFNPIVSFFMKPNACRTSSRNVGCYQRGSR